MILPSIVSVSVTALNAVPPEYEQGSLALGATDKLDGSAPHGAQLGVGGLGEEHRRQQADGHTDDGSAQRAVDAGQDKGQDAEQRLGHGAERRAAGV